MPPDADTHADLLAGQSPADASPPLATYKSLAEHEATFKQIWTQFPDRQKRTSSTWWFFILFPRDNGAYGPRQLMFTIASRAGGRMRINDVPQTGMDLRRPVVDDVDRFPAMAVGWYCDGQRVHEDFVKGAGDTLMDTRNSVIKCAGPSAAGDGRFSMAFSRTPDHPLAMRGAISSPRGAAHFDAWGDLDSVVASPDVSVDFDNALAGVHYIGWRRMHFRGDFDLPTGRETLEGMGFFQRVCMNVPVFPWKWIWALFPDGSLFSAYVPYVGLNLLRRHYGFFRSQRAERTAMGISGSAFWAPPGSAPSVRFERARVTPVLRDGRDPAFNVAVSNDRGDHLSYVADTYGHSRFFIDRPILGTRLETHWDYNEYMFRMEQVNGVIGGRPITAATMGQGYGSLEYTWGLGL